MIMMLPVVGELAIRSRQGGVEPLSQAHRGYALAREPGGEAKVAVAAGLRAERPRSLGFLGALQEQRIDER